LKLQFCWEPIHGQAEPIPESHLGDTSLVAKSTVWDEILLVLSSLFLCLFILIWLANFPFVPHLLQEAS